MKIECPSCGQRYEVDEYVINHKVECVCGIKWIVSPIDYIPGYKTSWRNLPACNYNKNKLRAEITFPREITAGECHDLLVKHGKVKCRGQGKPPSNKMAKILSAIGIDYAIDSYAADIAISRYEESAPPSWNNCRSLILMGISPLGISQAKASFVVNYYPSPDMFGDLNKSGIKFGPDISRDEAVLLLKEGQMSDDQIRYFRKNGIDYPPYATHRWADSKIDWLSRVKRNREKNQKSAEYVLEHYLSQCAVCIFRKNLKHRQILPIIEFIMKNTEWPYDYTFLEEYDITMFIHELCPGVLRPDYERQFLEAWRKSITKIATNKIYIIKRRKYHHKIKDATYEYCKWIGVPIEILDTLSQEQAADYITKLNNSCRESVF